MSELAFRWLVLIVDVSLKAIFLGGAAALALWVLRVRDSSARHVVWLCVLLAMLALPFLSLALPGVALPVPGGLESVLRDVAQLTPTSAGTIQPERRFDAAPAKSTRQADVSDNPRADRLMSSRREDLSDQSSSAAGTQDTAMQKSSQAEGVAGGLVDRSSAEFPQHREIGGSMAPSDHLATRYPAWPLIVVAIWLAVAVVQLSRLLLGVLITRRIAWRSIPVLSAESPVPGVRSARRPLKIGESGDVLVPLTTGPFRPVVLLPRDWREWSSEKLSDVLNHELSHIRRHDCLTAFLADLTVCAYWFHPVAWWLRRKLAVLAEEACDDAVIASTGNRTAYARHLLEIASVLSTRSGRVVYSGLSMARQSNVEDRINAILDFSRPLSRRLTWAATVLIAALVVPLVGVAAALRPAIASKSDAGPNSAAAAKNSSDRDRQLASNNPNPAASASSAEPAEGKLTITGRVLLPDGSPAANAIVSALGNQFEHGVTVRADAAGQFRISHIFGWYQRIHARTQDWRLQAHYPITPDTVRVTSQKPVEIKLVPAREQRVFVTSGGKPAEGVYLTAYMSAKARTGPDGMASLWLPETTGFGIEAWHPRLGGGRIIVRDTGRAPTKIIELALVPPKPHAIRVVDQNGQPVAGLRSALSVTIARRNGFTTGDIDEAVIETDSRGEVTVPWLPAEFKEVAVTGIFGPWKPDGGANRKAENNSNRDVAIAHVQGLRPATGRLIMPAGASAEGILITGHGANGEPNRVHHPFARARKDGTFTFLAAPGYAYCLAVSDSQWACDSWTGVVLKGDPSKGEIAEQVPITLNAYPAIPLTVRVTRGPKAEPWAGVNVSGMKLEEFEWTDGEGRRREGGAILGDQRLTTGADGTAHFAISRGRYDLSISAGDWGEQRRIRAMSDAPISITVNRPWLGNRRIAGRMMLGRSPRAVTPTTTLWSQPAVETKILPDGRFTLTTGSRDVYLLAADRKDHLAYFRHLGPDDSIADVDLTFQAPASYSGQVVDSKGKPLAGYRVLLAANIAPVQWNKLEDALLEEAKCDDQGRFHFDKAPAGLELCVCVVDPSKEPRAPWQSVERNLLLKPGEAYADDRISISPEGAEEPAVPQITRPKKSAAARLSDRIRDARLAQLRVLVVAGGDSTQAVQGTMRNLLDFEGFREMIRYLPLEVKAEELPGEAALFTRLGLRAPKGGEILLVVLDGEGRQVSVQYVPARDGGSALQQGAEFVKKHMPAGRDAHKLMAAAQELARQTDRRLWIIEGETRCAPCFRLARWLDDQHALLDRDYVFVKLLSGIDENVGDVLESLHQRPGGGIPWFAITDADGKLLATSENKHGNIGIPEDREGRDHLRQMLQKTSRKLTPDEINRLIRSLLP